MHYQCRFRSPGFDPRCYQNFSMKQWGKGVNSALLAQMRSSLDTEVATPEGVETDNWGPRGQSLPRAQKVGVILVFEHQIPLLVIQSNMRVRYAKISLSKQIIGAYNHRKKPLQNRRIYLDVKNCAVSSKLESNLKSLGATIEVFLVEEVNYVVTDRPHWASGSPLPSPSFLTPAGPCSVSPATTESPGGGQGKHLAKSRAGAMLEKVRLQPQQITLDPLDNASRWGIPIWPLDKVTGSCCYV
uniref:Uncharacterized protein n=1 Tax=Timema cristinae TaxID=61476 RepID=A0A7R9CC90_TIMCR|nr:unnamed protein product [Timema cristinae]